MNQHVTKLEETADPKRYQPRCTCGWLGAKLTARARAKAAADMHRAHAKVEALVLSPAKLLSATWFRLARTSFRILCLESISDRDLNRPTTEAPISWAFIERVENIESTVFPKKPCVHRCRDLTCQKLDGHKTDHAFQSATTAVFWNDDGVVTGGGEIGHVGSSTREEDR